MKKVFSILNLGKVDMKKDFVTMKNDFSILNCGSSYMKKDFSILNRAEVNKKNVFSILNSAGVNKKKAFSILNPSGVTLNWRQNSTGLLKGQVQRNVVGQ